jgi:hypothetical protein
MTICLFDDSGNSTLFKNKDSYFNQQLKICRDIGFIFFLAIHGTNQLSPSIKENTAAWMLGKGMSRERLSVIFRQINTSLDFQGLLREYVKLSALSDKRWLCIDNIAQVFHLE